jgi:hypothetical protein
MAYTVPPTKATGDALTAAEWNAAVRDNMIVGVPDIITAKGDLVVGTAVNAAAALAVGSDFKILQAKASAASGVEWTNPIYGVAARAAAQNITANTLTDIVFDTNVVDLSPSWYTTGGLVVPAGYGNRQYRIGIGGFWDTQNDATMRGLYLTIATFVVAGQTASGIVENVWQSLYYECTLQVGEIVKIQVKQRYSSTLAFNSARMTISMVR